MGVLVRCHLHEPEVYGPGAERIGVSDERVAVGRYDELVEPIIAGPAIGPLIKFVPKLHYTMQRLVTDLRVLHSGFLTNLRVILNMQ